MPLKKRIIVNTSTGHNKYWMLTPDPVAPDNRYLVRNGRLGTNGQAQKALDPWTARSKLQNKVGDGYREVTEREFERLNTQAVIVGSTNKCESLQWVELRGIDYHPVDDDYLANPEYDPKLLVQVSTRKPIDGSTDFWLLFTPDASYELDHVTKSHSGCYRGGLRQLVGELKLLGMKVEEAMGRLFNG